MRLIAVIFLSASVMIFSAYGQQATPHSGKAPINLSAGLMPKSTEANRADGSFLATARAGAEQGDASAQYLLGTMYDTGVGVRQNYAKAAIWYRKAAVQGNAVAQCALGTAYYAGQGVPKDNALATSWWFKGAKQGDSLSEMWLGRAYDQGNGVPKDSVQSVIWYRKAAEQGNAVAQCALGTAYYAGQGVPQDYSQAAVWWRKSAERGISEAQGKMAILYLTGHGVPQDYAEAYFWLDLAASQKFDLVGHGKGRNLREGDVAKLRDDTARHLTPAELSQVQERARKWFEAHQTQSVNQH